MKKGFLTMQEIVKYDNFLNSLSLKGFSSDELDMLMVLCQKARDQEDSIVEIPFSEIKTLASLKMNKTVKQFKESLDAMNRKLCQVVCKLENGPETIFFVLFPTFGANYETQTLRIRVNDDFRFVLNSLTKNFTRFELEEFTHLTSRYAKNLYRQLKQFRRAGEYRKSIEDFRELLDCPSAYTNKRFMDNCIKPAIAELKQSGYFTELRIEFVRAHKRGAPITHVIITFQPDKQIPGQMRIEDYQAQPQAPVKKNSFNNFPQNNYDFEELENKILHKEIGE